MNSDQRKVVEDISHNVHVAAGAGTGKTTALTERYLYIVEQNSQNIAFDIKNILAITFTKAAALEMHSRIRSKMTQKFARMEQDKVSRDKLYRWGQLLSQMERAQIMTIDSLQGRILREHPVEARINPDYQVMDKMEYELEMYSLAGEFCNANIDDVDLSALLTEYGSQGIIKTLVELDQKNKPQIETLDISALLQDPKITVEKSVNMQDAGSKSGCTGSEQTVTTEQVVKWQDCERERSEHWLKLYRKFICYARGQKDGQDIISYGDVARRALDLLRKNEAVRHTYQQQYRYIMVDEFQDTNDEQRKLIYLLCGDNEDELSGDKLFVVGDEKQSIYRFRGAEVKVFNDVCRKMDDAGGNGYKLAANYRCTPQIINFVNQVFGQEGLRMKNYIPLQIPSDRTNLYDGPKPVMKYYVGEPEEKKNVADRCEEESRGVVSYIFQLREEGIEYDDIAVLLPKMTNVGSLVEAFKANNIPFVIVGGKDFYKAQEVTDLLNVFRLLTDRTNVIALLGLLRSPFLGCTDQEITDLCHRISPDSDTLLLDELLDSGDSLSKNLARSRRILDDLLLAARVLPVPELWQSVLQTLNVEYILRSQEQGEQKWANVVKLESLCLKYCSSKSCTLAAWLQFIEDAMDSSDETAADLPADRAVRIMTIHKSKGLEFKVVILPYLDRSQGRSDNSYVSFCFEENLFGAKAPNEVKELKNKDAKAFDVLKDKNNQAETAERIRLLYVALTRSKERLYLSGWKNKKKDENSDEVLPGTESLWNMVQYGKKFADTEKTLGEDVFNGGAAGSNCRRMQTRIVDKSEYVVPLTTYFTPSMLQTYLYCQRQYFYTHVCRLPQYKEEGGNSTNDFNTLTAAEQGTLIHSALEYYTGSVDAAWDKAQKTKESQVLNQQGKDLNPAKKLFTDYVNSDLYKSIPEHEREVEFQLPADQGVAFKGVIDCIFPAEDGTYGVVDYKTGSKPQSPDDGYALQLGIYSRAVEMMKHGRVSSMSLHYLQDRGSGVDVKADGDKYQEALHLALEIQGKKREEEFDCTSDNHSCEFCGYAYMCRKETK